MARGHAPIALLVSITVAGAAALVQTAVGHSPLEVALVSGLLLGILTRMEMLGRRIEDVRVKIGEKSVSDQIGKAMSDLGTRMAAADGAVIERIDDVCERVDVIDKELRDGVIAKRAQEYVSAMETRVDVQLDRLERDVAELRGRK